jgi:hypothetical protein
MSTMSAHRRLPLSQEAPPLVRWRSWPLREHRLMGVVVVAALAAAVAGIHQRAGTSMALLAGAALVVSLWRFFVPVVFEVNVDGVHQWVLGRHVQIPWQSFRRYRIFSDGVLLLPHAEICPIDALRGLYLPWRDRREEVLANVRFYLDYRDRVVAP